MTYCNCTFSVLRKSDTEEYVFLRIILPLEHSESVKFLIMVSNNRRLDNLRVKTEGR
jgi:hypothetical protein